MNTSVADFTKLVPGFDFLQGLVKNAGSALPSIGQWVAPTLDPQELEKRIEELRTVQFWLEQNARMLAATIQALEVQRMTLTTLKTMNVQMSDLRESMRIKLPETPAADAADAPAEAPAPAPVAWPPSAATMEAAPAETKAARKATAAAPGMAGKAGGKAGAKAAGTAAAAGAGAAGMVDPMQWWGALTKQFGELAASALKDNAGDAARELAGSVVKQSIDAAGQTLHKAAAMPGKVVSQALAAAVPAPAASRAARPAARKAAKTPRATPAAKPRSGGR
jgi:hypothetical protein